MKRNVAKLVLSGAALALGLGIGANQASADSFSVSVHTPTVSVGYSNDAGRYHSGYVAVPAPVYCPPAPVVVERPVVVRRPVVVQEVHVCSYDRRPVTRVRYDRFGCPVYFSEYVTVRTCDDRYHRHDHHHEYTHVRYDKHGHGRDHGYVRYDDHHERDHDKHYRDRDDDYRRYAKFDRDDRDDRRDRGGPGRR